MGDFIQAHAWALIATWTVFGAVFITYVEPPGKRGWKAFTYLFIGGPITWLGVLMVASLSRLWEDDDGGL